MKPNICNCNITKIATTNHSATHTFQHEFEDLDEIIARFVQPMANNAREICAYKYYHDPGAGTDETGHLLRDRKVMIEYVRKEKAANPTKIPLVVFFIIW